MDVRLLNRTTRRVHLTEAGSFYLQRAQLLLDELDNLDNQITDYTENAKGHLRISAPVTFSTLHMPRLLFDFQQKYPGISVDLQLNDRKVDIVDEGFDIALRIGQLKNSSLIAKFIFPITLHWFASPAYIRKHGQPNHPDELQHHRYLKYSYLEQQSDDQQNKQHFLSSNNGELLVNYAIQGDGLVLQPTFIAHKALDKGQLEIVMSKHNPAPIGLYAVYTHRKLMANKVRCFIDFIQDYYGNPPYWDKWQENYDVV